MNVSEQHIRNIVREVGILNDDLIDAIVITLDELHHSDVSNMKNKHMRRFIKLYSNELKVIDVDPDKLLSELNRYGLDEICSMIAETFGTKIDRYISTENTKRFIYELYLYRTYA